MRYDKFLFSGILLILSTALVSSAAFGQEPKVGEPAPEITLAKVVSPPSAAVPTLAGLRGKIVVLEFWGTWCGPCIKSIPHLNELADGFAQRGVEFISISNDPERVLRDFLSTTKLKGVVALDRLSSTIKRYGINGYPTTLVIDREGIILARTYYPATITNDTMDDALAGRPLRLKPAEAEVPTEPAPQPLFEVWVRPSTSSQLYGGRSSYRVDGFGLSPRACLAWAFDVPESRVVLETALPDRKYDLKAGGGPEDKNTLPALQLAVESVLGVAVTREARKVPAYVLALIPGQAHKLRKPGGEHSNDYINPETGMLMGTNTGLAQLVSLLDWATSVPVLDETGLKARYTYDFKMGRMDYESLRDAIREQLGLDFRQERRKLEVIVVRNGQGAGH